MLEPVQLLGWIAAVFVVISFQGRNLQQLVVMQLLGYGFLVVHFSLLGAVTGAVMTLIGIARLVLALVLQRHPRLRPLYLLFVPVILLACWLTLRGPESLLPAIGYLLGTFAVYQRNMLRTRMLFLAAHPFWPASGPLVTPQATKWANWREWEMPPPAKPLCCEASSWD